MSGCCCSCTCVGVMSNLVSSCSIRCCECVVKASADDISAAIDSGVSTPIWKSNLICFFFLTCACASSTHTATTLGSAVGVVAAVMVMFVEVKVEDDDDDEDEDKDEEEAEAAEALDKCDMLDVVEDGVMRCVLEEMFGLIEMPLLFPVLLPLMLLVVVLLNTPLEASACGCVCTVDCDCDCMDA